MRTIAFATMFFAASTTALCQNPAKEPDTLQALLAEVHQLRQDIEGMTLASQRVQIALYTLQMQDAAVARSAQRVDSAHNKCAGEESNRQHVAADVQRFENAVAAGTLAEPEARDVRARLAEMKATLEAQTASVQACQAAEADAASQLRNDQATLAEIRERINRLDRSLEQLGGGK